jgi:putative DNA primase/helicase
MTTQLVHKPKSAEDYAREETAAKRALNAWVELVAKGILRDVSEIADEILDRLTLSDVDDEEEDDDANERADARWEELIDDAILNAAPEINGVNIRAKFTPKVLANRVRAAVKALLAENPNYAGRIRQDVPGKNVRKFGRHYRVSSLGVFTDNSVDRTGLTAFFSGGWVRIAKDRIEPVAWSYQLGNERRNWRYHFEVTDRDDHHRPLSIPRGKLASEKGAPAIALLMNAGVHVVVTKSATTELAKFLRYRSKTKIVRVPHTGWVQDGQHWLFVRPDKTLLPPDISSRKRHLRYHFDGAPGGDYGLRVSGTAGEWARDIAAPLEGSSLVALALGTFFATPVLIFAEEQAGGWHIHGPSSIGKTLAAAVGQSIYGLPFGAGVTDTFGRSWQGTATGIEQFAALRSDVGMGLDEIGTGEPRPIRAAIYELSGGTEKLRGTSNARLRSSQGFRVLVFSTGEKSLGAFLGRQDDAEGRKKRLVDVPAEIAPGTSFETIAPEQIVEAGRRFYSATARLHGAVGEKWQQHLVNLGPASIQEQLNAARSAWLALPEVETIAAKAHPQVRSVVRRFALMAAALRMAIAARLLPWSVANADAGILACASRWAEQRGDLGVSGEVLRTVARMRTTINAALSERFVHLQKNTKGEHIAATEVMPDLLDGYVKDDDRILLRPEAWFRLCDGCDAAAVAEHLRERGWLIPGETAGKPRKERIGKKQPQRFYVLRRSFLLSGTGNGERGDGPWAT